MQERESKQELTEYYKTVFTLKNGVQIEVWTKSSPDLIPSITRNEIIIEGFIKNPLLVEKKVMVQQEDIAAIETIKNPCIAQVIPWPEDVDINSGVNLTQHPKGCTCSGCYSEYLKLSENDKPLVDHKPECAIHNDNFAANSPSEVVDCDCGVIVLCTGKAVENMSTKEIIES